MPANLLSTMRAPDAGPVLPLPARPFAEADVAHHAGSSADGPSRARSPEAGFLSRPFAHRAVRPMRPG